MFPEEISEVDMATFENDSIKYAGFELVFQKNEKSFLVGYNRLNNEQMYGWLRIVGNPVTNF